MPGVSFLFVFTASLDAVKPRSINLGSLLYLLPSNAAVCEVEAVAKLPERPAAPKQYCEDYAGSNLHGGLHHLGS